jgi:uncharacterized coiled-coil protein SlyX
MADVVENLMLEHLKRFQATLDRMDCRQEEIIGRITNLEGSLASMMGHLAHLAGAGAAQQLGLDNVNRRLDRIERRLELSH